MILVLVISVGQEAFAARRTERDCVKVARRSRTEGVSASTVSMLWA